MSIKAMIKKLFGNTTATKETPKECQHPFEMMMQMEGRKECIDENGPYTERIMFTKCIGCGKILNQFDMGRISKEEAINNHPSTYWPFGDVARSMLADMKNKEK